MPRTTLELPTSTTRRLDIGDRLPVASYRLPKASDNWQPSTGNPSLRDQKIARADSGHFVSIAEKRASRFINAHPRSTDGPIADDAGNAIARFVDRQRAPLCEN